MFSSFFLILAQNAPAGSSLDPANPAPVRATATASATILQAARIDFSRIPAPRRPRADQMRLAEFE
jgi:hypothetical protein